ncbi:monosaccharide transporter [Basidiobolus meristosporus CBS 931.73]|uniref:Monosaccharide transporter n=1 Tax=Basidiobolus meristosporus CBS 931.73 TaxID=1314790 RepID=A0A1Y1XWP0_9FUNG|nr:monosaccharide transporter [Basidiobolus meristosporus CBS 931.73]|eukprot:ORX90142.1 monosaccharide transporter [Basidiobolus meristosporus CBS 931.73]
MTPNLPTIHNYYSTTKMLGRSTKEAKTSNDSSQAGFSFYTVMCVSIACLVSFNNGWNTSDTNIIQSSIIECENPDEKFNGFPSCFPMGDWLWGFAVSSFSIGGAIGGLSAGWSQAKFGRRNSLLFNNIFFIVGALLLGLSKNKGTWIVGRFFTGIGSGFGTVVLPTYIGEVSTTRVRGAYGAMTQLTCVIGQLVTQAAGLGLSSRVGWRICMALTGAIAILQLVTLSFITETPRYYISKDRIDDAEKSLLKLRKGMDVTNELQTMVDARAAAKVNGEQTSIVDGFKFIMRDSLTRKHAFMCMFLCVIQQLCGINGIMYYSTSIFTSIYGNKTAQYLTVGVGAINLLATIVTILLIDRVGRKFLVLLSLAGMASFNVLMIIGIECDDSGLVILGLFAFVVSFALGMGPIPFLIISELIPTRAVSTVASSALGLNWLGNFVVGFFFPSLKNTMHGYVFLIFVGCCIAGFVGVLFFLPETKGRSIEEITGHGSNSATTNEPKISQH